MEFKDLIGQTVCYRPLNERKMKESRVVSARIHVNLADNKIAIFQMENGDEASANAVYADPFQMNLREIDSKVIVDTIVHALYRRDESLVRALKGLLSDQKHID